MPIYAYKCARCGHQKDVLQKISDPLLTTCPACGAEAFEKQVTAAGFQLKGSGWYVTDFRDGNKGGAKKTEEAPAAEGAAKPEASTDAKPAAPAAAKGDGAAAASPAPAAPAAAPAAAPSPPPAPGSS